MIRQELKQFLAYTTTTNIHSGWAWDGGGLFGEHSFNFAFLPFIIYSLL